MGRKKKEKPLSRSELIALGNYGPDVFEQYNALRIKKGWVALSFFGFSNFALHREYLNCLTLTEIDVGRLLAGLIVFTLPTIAEKNLIEEKRLYFKSNNLKYPFRKKEKPLRILDVEAAKDENAEGKELPSKGKAKGKSKAELEDEAIDRENAQMERHFFFRQLDKREVSNKITRLLFRYPAARKAVILFKALEMQLHTFPEEDYPRPNANDANEAEEQKGDDDKEEKQGDKSDQ